MDGHADCFCPNAGPFGTLPKRSFCAIKNTYFLFRKSNQNCDVTILIEFSDFFCGTFFGAKIFTTKKVWKFNQNGDVTFYKITQKGNTCFYCTKWTFWQGTKRPCVQAKTVRMTIHFDWIFIRNFVAWGKNFGAKKLAIRQQSCVWKFNQNGDVTISWKFLKIEKKYKINKINSFIELKPRGVWAINFFWLVCEHALLLFGSHWSRN